jgi:hypothetical protein
MDKKLKGWSKHKEESTDTAPAVAPVAPPSPELDAALTTSDYPTREELIAAAKNALLSGCLCEDAKVAVAAAKIVLEMEGVIGKDTETKSLGGYLTKTREEIK